MESGLGKLRVFYLGLGGSWVGQPDMSPVPMPLGSALLCWTGKMWGMFFWVLQVTRGQGQLIAFLPKGQFTSLPQVAYNELVGRHLSSTVTTACLKWRGTSSPMLTNYWRLTHSPATRASLVMPATEKLVHPFYFSTMYKYQCIIIALVPIHSWMCKEILVTCI